MRAAGRSLLVEGYVLHGRDWRETSRILDCLSRDNGRFSVVARGARRAGSPWRAVLQPFQPLLLSWTMRGELGTLIAAEATAPAHRVGGGGERTLAAFYANELLLRGLAPHDPHPEVFEAYAATLAALAAGADEAIVLRRFELELLAGVGYGLRLDADGETGEPLRPDGWYRLDAERGPLALGVVEGVAEGVAEQGRAGSVCRGADLMALAAGTPDAVAARGPLRRALRGALDALLGDRPLRTRAVARELRRSVTAVEET